jgi:hypothetical protein
MALEISVGPEPLSPESWHTKPIIAECYALERVQANIERYARGLISGCSLLVAGYRGCGKTTIVQEALQRVWKAAEDEFRSEGRYPAPAGPLKAPADGRQAPYKARPLLVRIHGPDFLDDQLTERREETTVTPDMVERWTIDSALRETTRSLRRAASEEFARCFAARRPDLCEMAAQLKHELDSSPSLARLRQFWSKADRVQDGVLFSKAKPDETPADSPDPRSKTQGLKELLALWTIVDVERTVNESERDSGAVGVPAPNGAGREKHDDISSFMQEFRRALRGGDSILNVTIGLLCAAIVVGLVLSISHNPLMAILGASIAGIVTTLILSFVSAKEHSKSLMPAVSVNSFNQTLPVVVNRLYEAGLAPIFVVDELDKVECLEEKLGKVLKQMMHFVAGKAFFVFIADREYLEEIEGKIRSKSYPQEHTLFTDRLLVYHTAEELHQWLDQVIVAKDDDGKLVREVIRLVVLQRSLMHIGDVRTHLVPFLKNGRVDLTWQEVKEDEALCYACLMQIAVECVLRTPEASRLFKEQPQLAYEMLDLVYQPTRSWRLGESAFLRASGETRNEPSEAGGAPPVPRQYQGLFLEWSQQIVDHISAPATIDVKVNPEDQSGFVSAELLVEIRKLDPLLGGMWDLGQASPWRCDISGRKTPIAGDPRIARAQQYATVILDFDLLARNLFGLKLPVGELFTGLRLASELNWADVLNSARLIRFAPPSPNEAAARQGATEAVEKAYAWLNIPPVSRPLCLLFLAGVLGDAGVREELLKLQAGTSAEVQAWLSKRVDDHQNGKSPEAQAILKVVQRETQLGPAAWIPLLRQLRAQV